MKRTREAVEKLGGKAVGFWVTMGEYDVVAVIDMPNDQAVAVGTLGTVAQGNVTTQTMRAFSEDEFAEIVGKLP